MNNDILLLEEIKNNPQKYITNDIIISILKKEGLIISEKSMHMVYNIANDVIEILLNNKKE
jgi:hypothetical protein